MNQRSTHYFECLLKDKAHHRKSMLTSHWCRKRAKQTMNPAYPSLHIWAMTSSSQGHPLLSSLSIDVSGSTKRQQTSGSALTHWLPSTSSDSKRELEVTASRLLQYKRSRKTFPFQTCPSYQDTSNTSQQKACHSWEGVTLSQASPFC